MLDLQEAISLLERGDAREAARLLEEMSDRMPGYATARVLLARAYEGMDAWDEALHSWRQALHIIPNSPVVRRGLLRAAQMAASSTSLPRAAAVATQEDEFVEADEREWAAGDGEDPITEDSWADEGAWAHAELPAETPHLAEPRAWNDPELRQEPAAPEAAPAEERFDVAPTDEPIDVEPAEERPAPEHPGHDEEANAFQEDLDRLISELESARITPRPDLDDVPTPDLEDDIEDVVSETLAKIYASQGQFGEAARVYEMLASQQPEKRDHFTERAAEMRGRASDEG